MADDEEDFSLYLEIAKASPDGKYVRGWAMVTTGDDGQPVIDWEGEVMPIGVLRESVHEFMNGERVAKVMHDGKQTGAIVESVIVDDDFAQAMGITSKRRGWWAGMEVYDPKAQEKVRKGELKGFSIGGRGKLENV